AAVLTLNNRAFLLRGFRLVFEHREEPRRATRIAMPAQCASSPTKSPCGLCLVFAVACNVHLAHAHSALFVHFFSCVLIQQHIRRKTTSRSRRFIRMESCP